jgi:seryl-tRNA synthetase
MSERIQTGIKDAIKVVKKITELKKLYRDVLDQVEKANALHQELNTKLDNMDRTDGYWTNVCDSLHDSAEWIEFLNIELKRYEALMCQEQSAYELIIADIEAGIREVAT